MPTPDLKYAKGHFRHLALNRREAFIWYWARHSQTDENFKKYREAEPLVNNERTLDHVTLHELLANRLETIGVARRGLRGHAPQIFKTHSQFVLQEAVPQTSLIRLKSNIWATTKFFDPPNFWAGCATAQAGSSIPPTKIVRSGVVFVTRCIMSGGCENAGSEFFAKQTSWQGKVIFLSQYIRHAGRICQTWKVIEPAHGHHCALCACAVNHGAFPQNQTEKSKL